MSVDDLGDTERDDVMGAAAKVGLLEKSCYSESH